MKTIYTGESLPFVTCGIAGLSLAPSLVSDVPLEGDEAKHGWDNILDQDRSLRHD